jgi:hypothetical protein
MTERQRAGTLITLKIQPPIVRTAAGPAVARNGQPMLAYNKERNFHVFIDTSKVGRQASCKRWAGAG